MPSIRALVTVLTCTVWLPVTACAFDASGEAAEQDLEGGAPSIDSTLLEDATVPDVGFDVTPEAPDAADPPDAGADAARDTGVVLSDAKSESPIDEPIACSGAELPYAGHCYLVDVIPRTFLDARTACSAPGAHLVTINTYGEDTFVSATTIGLEAWMGLTRDPPSPPLLRSSFKWITGEPRDVDAWRGAEPDGTGQCAHHTSTGWVDSGCAETFAAVCERE